MESDSARHQTPEGSSSAAEARLALSTLDADSATLAQRVATPWWYHLALGGTVALFVGSQALPAAAASACVVLGVVALPLVVTTYARRYGFSLSEPAGPRSRRLLLMSVGVLLAAMLATVVIKISGVSPSWSLVAALVAFLATVLLSRRYDVALRREIAGGGSGNP
ncbi:hypothetical protein [Nesterenkonia lutea]|uniref:Flp pilus assembly protein TadB n=1 Tax=Nesterenkonia lutea TaxID=272919 RepID=A0ABR9JDH7_9MICC|nr:hypothetical protein [Nesterenkonia lutea]MBE1523990.1 Flp pilus assembly protein TadB [Nesterenkonia lutea]